MLLTVELAQAIVKKAMAIIHHNVNIIDHRGIIIASGDLQRVGEYHEAACEVIRSRCRMEIHNTLQASRFKNVQPGINHPIMLEGRVLFVIGISGEPVAIRRYAELAILTAELLVKQASTIVHINWQYRIRDLLIKQYLYNNNEPAKEEELSQQLAQHQIDLQQPLLPLLISLQTAGHLRYDTLGELLNNLVQLEESMQVVLLESDILLLLVNEPDRKEELVDKLQHFFCRQLSHYLLTIGEVSTSATLTYRLNQIKGISGFNPFSFRELSQLMVAIYYYDNPRHCG